MKRRSAVRGSRFAVTASRKPLTANRYSTGAAIVGLIGFLAGCTQDKTPTGQGRDRIVVHGVLNPGVTDQVIMLERTLSGRQGADTSLAYDSTDAVVSRGATPVSGARVVVVSSTGDSVVAIEDLARRGDGKGAGMYRFSNQTRTPYDVADTALVITPGSTYTLHVLTADDEAVQGTTTVPSPSRVARPSTTFRPFDRSKDSVFVYWDPVPQAARYLVRIDAPRGAFNLFVDSTEYLIAGGLRNTGVTGLPAVFQPGFTQLVTVGAVDRNYYDYYRSANDPFTGSGLITHLDGALGVFGSYAMLTSSQLSVSQPIVDPTIEGDWDRITPFRTGVPNSMRIYVESVVGQQRRLSGFWSSFTSGFPPPGLLGTTDDLLHVTIAILKGQSARDTAVVLDMRPTTPNHLVGRVRATGDSVDFVRRGTP